MFKLINNNSHLFENLFDKFEEGYFISQIKTSPCACKKNGFLLFIKCTEYGFIMKFPFVSDIFVFRSI